jgi:hypothetical protein
MPRYWQDRARTIPASNDDDPIAVWEHDDGRVSLQPDSMKQPTLRGGAPHFDGVDDCMYSACLAVHYDGVDFTLDHEFFAAFTPDEPIIVTTDAPGQG